MKIVVLGGSGLIGTKLAGKVRKSGHDVLAASPNYDVIVIGVWLIHY